MKPYPEYKPTGLAWLPQVPSGWKVLHIRELFEERKVKVSDKDFAPLTVSRGGIVPQMENVAKSEDGDNRKLVRAGDFVINSRSDRKSSSGVSSLDGSVSLINLVLTPRQELDRGYAHHLLKCNDFVEEYYRNGRGIVADLWTTRYSEMKAISLPVPPLAEQRAIVSYLDRETAKIDRLIQLKERMVELLQEKKQATISRVVTRGLDPNAELVDSGVDWLGQVPKGWKVVPLKYLLDILPGYAFDSNAFAQNGVKLLRGINVGVSKLRWNEVVYWQGEIPKEIMPYSLTEGDLVVGLDRPWIAEGTRIAFVTQDDLPSFLVQRVCRIRTRGKVDLRYACCWLASDAFMTALGCETTGVSVPHISTGQIGEFRIALPSLTVQREIVAYLDAATAKIDAAVKAIEKSVGLLKERRVRLVSDAVTGRGRVSEVVI